MDQLPNTISTIRSQLFEYRIFQIIQSNSALHPLCQFYHLNGGFI